MGRLVTGWILIIVGFAALGTELFALIILDHFLILNPTLTIIRLAIWVALIWFGFRVSITSKERTIRYFKLSK